MGKNLLGGSYGRQRAFGGHVVARALSCAVRTVEDPKFLIRSVHCYYIRPVNCDSEVIYHVARLKDGRSISIRGVRATQGEKTMFSCLVSLSAEEKEKIGLTHTDRVMPQVDVYPQENEEVAIDPRTRKVPMTLFPVKLVPANFKRPIPDFNKIK